MSDDSIWGDSLPLSSAEEALLRDASILGKIKSPKKVSRRQSAAKSIPWEEREAEIAADVEAILGRHRESTETITSLRDYEAYVDAGIAKGEIAVDTETDNSLDPITCKLMGLCLYVDGMRQVYVPINHVSADGSRLASQLDEAAIRPALERLQASDAKVIYHNASFDIRVIQCQVGVELRCDWDTMIASQLIDENEPASLKSQYMLHIDPTHGKYDIEELFRHEEYARFSPELFALYAATDPMMTYRLYRWQKDLLSRPENARLLKCYEEIELPCIKAVKDMELRGVCVDREYMGRLADKYHAILDGYAPKIDAELERLRPKIEAWKASPAGRELVGKKNKKPKAELLSDPVNIESPTQLAILVYDVLGIPPVDKSKGRSVDKNTIPLILEKHDIPLLSVIAERKKFQTLVQNFIDKLPGMINPKTGRIHCSYNQVGTATGRFSCSDPNL